MPDDTRDQKYMDERKIYIDLLKESGNQLDKNILYISTGALILSITFIEKILGLPEQNTIILLLTSWVLLLICILSTLFSFFTSYKSCLKEIKILDCKYESKDYKETNIWTIITNILNIVSIIAITFGIAFQVAFSYTNLDIKSKYKTMESIWQKRNYKKELKSLNLVILLTKKRKG
jgi:hypothetical protein